MLTTRINTLRPDNPIRFGSQGNYLTFAPQGFSADEHTDQTWNDGFVTSLQVRILAIADDTRLRITLAPYVVAEKVPFQTLDLYINGLWIAFLRAQVAERLLVELPGAYISPTANRLSFVMRNATRPSEIADGSDERRLAFAFREIALLRAA
jgi:hypothetical protein